MPKDVNWKTDRMIILKDYDLPRLPDSPDCPHLENLYIQSPRLTMIPSTFFQHMLKLQVLDLSNTNIVSLPTSISYLRSLQDFFLKNCCNLKELPTQIESLTNLKLFDINGTELMFIPKEIVKLKDLELLRVSLSQYAKSYIKAQNESLKEIVIENVVPRKMISELKKLKELCISVHPEAEWWEEEVKDIQNELCDLEKLKTLRWFLPTNKVLQQFILLERNRVRIFSNLSKFTLIIGEHPHLSCLPHGLETKFIEFENCLKWINTEEPINDVSLIMERAEALFLSRHWTLAKLPTILVSKLKYCLIAECNEMETLVEVDVSSTDVESRIKNGEKVGLELLRYLTIHCMNKLQGIWRGPIGKDSLSKLKILALHSCTELTSVFTLSVAQNLSCLTELTVEDCPKVMCLISSESHNVKYGPIFSSLEKIFLLDLPEMVSIFGGLFFVEELGTLLIYNCLKLRLSIKELPQIKKIEGEKEWWNDLDCDKSHWENIFVPLKEMRDLVEQLCEATNSLEHFYSTQSDENDEKKLSDSTDLREQVITADAPTSKGKGILFPSEEHEDYESYSLSHLETPDMDTDMDIFYPRSKLDPISLSGQENYKKNLPDSTDIREQVITAYASTEKGKGILFLPEEGEDDESYRWSHSKTPDITTDRELDMFDESYRWSHSKTPVITTDRELDPFSQSRQETEDNESYVSYHSKESGDEIEIDYFEEVDRLSLSGQEISMDINWNVDEINLKHYDLPQPQLLLPDSPICPILVKLFMQVPGLTVIPTAFFEHMPMLEVLDLSNTNIASLPTSIASLSLLQEFFLRDCCALIELPSQVGMLSKLKLFDGKGTELMFIPKEMGKLKDLEVLRVSLSQYAKDYMETNSDNETVIPQNIISKLKQLKELCISICPEAEWWEEEVKCIQSELCDLENLETLRWYLPTNEVLQQFILLEKNHLPIYKNLSNLMLTIGQHAQLTSCLPRDLVKKFEEFEKCLKWVNAEGNMDDVSKIMENAEALFMSRHWTVKKLSALNLTNLKYCLLAECNKMETLVEKSEDEDAETRIKNGENVGLELLQYLSIHHMNNLQSIWKGPIGNASLSKLTILAFHSCPQLTSIFTISIAQNLSCLIELTVEDCPKITSLTEIEPDSVCSLGFPSLQRIVLLDLPELVNISDPVYWPLKVTTLLIYNCQKLQYISLLEFQHMKQIQGEIEWWKDLDCDTSQWENIFVPLKRNRDLVEQLSEATNSLQHFHDILLHDLREQVITADASTSKGKGILFPSEDHEDDESNSGSHLETPDTDTDMDIFNPSSNLDPISLSGQENDERKSSNLVKTIEQVITADTPMDKGKGISIPPKVTKPKPQFKGSSKWKTVAAMIAAVNMMTSMSTSSSRMSGVTKPKRQDKSSSIWKATIQATFLAAAHGIRSFVSRNQGTTLSIDGAQKDATHLKSIEFTMEKISQATKNFSSALKVGEGKFGTVYKGQLQDGTLVAVKRAKKSKYGKSLGREFVSLELQQLLKVGHLNLVKFYGYFHNKDENIFIFEYVPNGTLREHLDCIKGNVLSLTSRLDIAIDVAHAITYLHTNTDHPLIHGDIKSSKVLLTETLRAKVADSGFARLAAYAESIKAHVSTQSKWTADYIDPEYMRTGQLTEKSDVYSFGILLLELVTGRRPVEANRKPEERVTVRWVVKNFTDGFAISILDPKLEKSEANGLVLKKILELALECVDPDRKNRPTMNRCAEALWNIRNDFKELLV